MRLENFLEEKPGHTETGHGQLAAVQTASAVRARNVA
jgi:hypothetical protein